MDFQHIREIFGVSEEEIYEKMKEQLGENITEAEIAEAVTELIGNINQKLSKSYTLEECLSFLRKEELIDLMKMLSFHGYSKMRKEELIHYLKNAFTAPDFMPRMYVSLTNNEVAMLWQLCAMNVPIVTTDIMYTATELLRYGFCYLDEHGKHLVLPEELQQSFQGAKEDDMLSREQQRYSAIYDVCNAAVYFYGVYPIPKLLEHIQADAGISLNEQELIAWHNFSALYREEFFFKNGFIVSTALEQTPENIIALQQIQKNKKYTFWPTTEQQKELSMEQWVIDEALYESFWAFAPQLIENEFGDILSVSRFVEMSIRTGAPFEALIGFLSGQIFELDAIEEVDALIAVVQKIWNNTPMWENGGYSLLQLRAQKDKETGTAHKNNVISLAAHKEKKKKNK